MMGLLIALACVFVIALSAPVAIAAASMHGHPIGGVGLLSIPLAPVATVIAAIAFDIGWWLLLIAAFPVLLMIGGLMLKDPETGQNMFSYPPFRRTKSAKSG